MLEHISSLVIVKVAASRCFTSDRNCSVLHFVHCPSSYSSSNCITLHLHLMQDWKALVNHWRACAGGSQYLSCVCLSVCLSVTTLAATSLISTLKMRVYLRPFLVLNSWIFDKTFCSENMQMSIYSP